MTPPKRARGALEDFVRQMATPRSTRSRHKEPVILTINAHAEAHMTDAHFDEILGRFCDITGQEVDLDAFPHAWILLCLWDDEWVELTNPNLEISAAKLIISHALITQLFDILVTYEAITQAASELGMQALNAVIESRSLALHRRHGKEGLMIELVPGFDESDSWLSNGSSDLH